MLQNRKKILIIKLAAMGDALRTTTILPALKEQYKNCHISWVTDRRSYYLLKFCPLIDRLLVLDFCTKLRLRREKFDLILSFDEAVSATRFANLCNAEEKKGFSITKEGKLTIFNPASEYALRMTYDNDLKFKKNKKTYPEIIYEIAGLNYNKQEYVLEVPKEEKFCQDFLKKFKIRDDDILIGIFTGCGRVYPTKKWTIQGYADLINCLNHENRLRIVLLGGPEEKKRNEKIKSLVKKEIIDSGCNNTLSEFINLINLMDLVISADTLALHLAIALKKRIVGIFTSTSASEIELYGRGQIIKANIDCSPCYKKECNFQQCLTNITAQEILEAVKKQLEFIKKPNLPLALL